MYAGNLDPYQDLDCLLEGFDRVGAVEPRARLVLVTHRAAHPNTQARARLLAAAPGVTVQTVNSFAAAARAVGAPTSWCVRAARGRVFRSRCSTTWRSGGRSCMRAPARMRSRTGVSGLLFDDGEPSSLARAVLRVVRDPALGRAARPPGAGDGARALWLAARARRVDGGVRFRGGRDRGRRQRGAPCRPADSCGAENGAGDETHDTSDRWTPADAQRRQAGPHGLIVLAALLLVGSHGRMRGEADRGAAAAVGEPLSPNLLETRQYSCSRATCCA